MSKVINILSPRKVQTTVLAGLYADGGNLYLKVEPSGAKRWAFIFQHGGKRREMGLGSLNSVSIAAAREAAADARALVAKDIDPIASRKMERAKGVTFGSYARDLVATLRPQWRNEKHVYQWSRSIEVHCAALEKFQ